LTVTPLQQRFLNHVSQTSPFSLGLEVGKAKGVHIYDVNGRPYLDFISGIGVTNLGHCHPAVVEAVCRQAQSYAHTMVYGEHIQEPQVELAEKIADIAPDGLNCVYFLSTGSEANDAALKMAAKLTGRSRYVAFTKAYHGDTVGAAACFGNESYRKPFALLLPQVDFLRFNDLEALESINQNHAAVIVEPVQGEGGIRLPAPGFLQAIRDHCTQTGTMLIFDEVQTGFGRLGGWFAAGVFNVTPDIIVMGKAMGAGLPLAGLLASRESLNRFAADPPFSHITTFGGNPISCAAGLAGIRSIEYDRLLTHASAMGEGLLKSAQEIMAAYPEKVTHVRGLGLMIGVELKTEAMARQVVEKARDYGVLFETTLLDEKTVRLSPPLIITPQHCHQGIDALARAIERL